MWNEILNLAIKNGLWAVLFLGLFVFVIKDSSKREKKYQQTIKDLTDSLGIVKEIRNDIDDIKDIVFNSKKSSNFNIANNQKNSKTKQNLQKNIKKTLKNQEISQEIEKFEVNNEE